MSEQINKNGRRGNRACKRVSLVPYGLNEQHPTPTMQGYWPEVNVLVPTRCLDASGVPDYNAVVEVTPAGRVPQARVAAVVPA